jgi:curved DNA-binding protein CbpA
MAGLRSLYDVLNVAPDAEPIVVEAAYKALIKKYHPDQAVEAPVSKNAAAINEAFAVLKDPARRTDYDHRLWTKQQALRLAQLQAAGGSAGPRFAALGGWLIAGLLACALAAVALGKTITPPPLATAAEAAEPEDADGLARAAAAKAAAAEAAHDRVEIPSSEVVVARVDAQHGMHAFRSVPARVRAAPPAAAMPYRRARPAPPPKRNPRREPDFLEREGYIY